MKQEQDATKREQKKSSWQLRSNSRISSGSLTSYPFSVQTCLIYFTSSFIFLSLLWKLNALSSGASLICLCILSAQCCRCKQAELGDYQTDTASREQVLNTSHGSLADSCCTKSRRLYSGGILRSIKLVGHRYPPSPNTFSFFLNFRASLNSSYSSNPCGISGPTHSPSWGGREASLPFPDIAPEYNWGRESQSSLGSRELWLQRHSRIISQNMKTTYVCHSLQTSSSFIMGGGVGTRGGECSLRLFSE